MAEKPPTARDVLAAEEFGVPAPDPSLHRRPITLPGDPTGIAEPHDVLAAEEFALPATDAKSTQPNATGAEPFDRGRSSRGALAIAAAVASLVAAARARRTRRTRRS